MRLSFCVSIHTSLVISSGALGSLLHTWLKLAHPLMWWWETWLTLTHCKAFWWTSNRRIISHCCKIPILKQCQGVSVYFFNIHLKLSVLGTVRNRRRHRDEPQERVEEITGVTVLGEWCVKAASMQRAGAPHLTWEGVRVLLEMQLRWWPWAEDWGNE